MYTTQSPEYDVAILGASFAGLCQARHLMLNIPNIRIALVDTRTENRLEYELGISESTVEIADLFLTKELGLHDYLIENHIPRSTLSFHWPKHPAQTETLDDYYHVWCNRQLSIASFQINCTRFERDLLQMSQAMGAVVYQGTVDDVELTKGDTSNTVKIQVGEGEVVLKAQHVIDAAGRQFIIGRKQNNLLFGRENLSGLDNGSAWLRVKNVDRTIFHDGYAPTETSTSRYYSTNHYFGYGHWLWMTPTDIVSKELSIGIVHYRDVFPSEGIDTLDKFLTFLKANHNLLYQLVDSGEIVDFHCLPQIAHKSKTLFSEDNWYVIGDAACFFGAFYCTETTLVAFAAESVTEIIRAKLANEADAEKKRSAYNDFNLYYQSMIDHIYHGHAEQLGHASIMSWRMYLDWMWWFGIHVPMYVGKWHLSLKFIPKFLQSSYKNMEGFWMDLFQQCDRLVKRGANLGLMDCYRADQLPGGYFTPKYFDNFLENTKFEPLRCNVFTGMKCNFFYAAIWYMLFQWKGFGLSGLLNPRRWRYFFRFLSLSAQSALAELIYHLKIRKGLPDNSQVEKMRQEFKGYQYRPELQSWIAQVPVEEHRVSLQESNRSSDKTKVGHLSALN
jgi:flavin-dependent dehydrogenase